MRVLVFGGRDYDDAPRVRATLDMIHRVRPITLLIDGACHLGGADLLGHQWAVERGVPTLRFPVDCAYDGPWPHAGNRRNQRMLDMSHPDLGVRFPGRNGTRDMARRLEEAGVRCHKVRLFWRSKGNGLKPHQALQGSV